LGDVSGEKTLGHGSIRASRASRCVANVAGGNGDPWRSYSKNSIEMLQICITSTLLGRAPKGGLRPDESSRTGSSGGHR
jgi:hypothetical protein